MDPEGMVLRVTRYLSRWTHHIELEDISPVRI